MLDIASAKNLGGPVRGIDQSGAEQFFRGHFGPWGENSQLPHVDNIVFSFENVGESPLPRQAFHQRQLTAFKAQTHTTSRASLLPFAAPARICAMPAAISPTYELLLVLGTCGRLQFILFHLLFLSELPQQSHL